MDSLAASKHSSALMRMVSVLAALNTGKVKPDDMFDSGVGIFVYDNDTIYDHNWRQGGYGELTLRQALAYSSDVAIRSEERRVGKECRLFLTRRTSWQV